MHKNILLPALALALASCAPTVQQDPVYTKSQTYTGTCAQALAQLDGTAIRTRPAVLLGGNTWSTLRQISATPTSAAYTSTNGTFSVTTQATCTEANGKATLTLASSGQQQPYMDALNDALLKGITLPQ